ncbi:class I SAM-dependent methyltransferase [Geodermatophilus sp. SYSU D00758]
MDAAAVFWALHRDLPREAPGSDATTRALLDLAGPPPPGARAVDIGCGPGRSAAVLAEAGLRVVAIDLHEPFLRRARRAGTAAAPVAVVRADMAALPLRDGTVDLVWSEGAAYLVGVEAALRSWRRLLRPGGVLVLTDAVWTTAAPSAAARDFWAGYPGMRDARALAAAARAAGYDVLADRLLPDSDWAEYYDPLAAAIAAWPGPDEETAAALAGARAEIGLRRSHAGEYGYAALVLRATGGISR